MRRGRDLLQEPAREHGREQQFGVEAVFVLLLQPLDTVAGTGGARAVVVEVALAANFTTPRPLRFWLA